MLQKIAALFVLCVCFSPLKSVYAISEAEYQSLLKSSPNLREADRDLNIYWKQVWEGLEEKHKKQVLAGQRLWVKTERDEAARKYMAQGIDKASAYTKAIQERMNQLRVINENSDLSDDDLGSAKADDFYNSDENKESENSAALSAQATGSPHTSGSSPMPTYQYTDRLMDENKKTQQTLLQLLDLVNNTPAKIQKPSGKAYPLLPVLSRSLEEYAQFDRRLAQAMLEKSGGAKLTDPKQILDSMSSAWDSIGYSMEATCSQLFKDISPRQYFYLTGQHVMDICIPIVQFFFKGENSLIDRDFTC